MLARVGSWLGTLLVLAAVALAEAQVAPPAAPPVSPPATIPVTPGRPPPAPTAPPVPATPPTGPANAPRGPQPGASKIAPTQASGAQAAASSLRARFTALRTSSSACTFASAAVSPCVLASAEHLLDVAERIAKNFPTQAANFRARAERHIAAAERGEDLYPSLRGKIVSRGYRSPISQRVQGYSIYVPPDYTPERSWPLMIVLHGGSSNGNLFLGVVLGNNMDWKSYDKHLWDDYEPRWSPPFIVVAPDGYGQVLWRWMGEQDVLDVIEDVQKNYRVDTERVVLSGLSNGGVGAYALGSRHAYRFSVVQAIAGAPSWTDYAGADSVAGVEATLMRAWSALDLADNWRNTDFRYYHGTVDPGPMRPAYVHALDRSLDERKIPHTGKWFETGHDLLYLVHRHGKVYGELAPVRRATRPSEVHLVSSDYRAARQHWLEITRFERYPELARLHGKVEGEDLRISSENVSALLVHAADVPFRGDVYVDGKRVFERGKQPLEGTLSFVKSASGFQRGAPSAGRVKRAGLSGPLTDAYYERTVHVYGTQRAENTAALKQLAERSARGLPLWLWSVEQEVVPDTAVTPELAASAHLALYGTPGDNLVLDRIASKLPLRVEGDAVRVGAKLVRERGVGMRLIYPNPESPERYVIVQSAPTLDGVKRGFNLPDFVPDYVVYDASSAASRPRLVPGKRAPLRGFFDANWELSP